MAHVIELEAVLGKPLDPVEIVKSLLRDDKCRAELRAALAETDGEAPRVYTDEEVNRFVAREKRAAEAQCCSALGVATIEEAVALIAKAREPAK